MNKLVKYGLMVIVAGVVGYLGVSSVSKPVYEDYVGTISELRKLDENIMCTFEHVTPESSMVGTVYINGTENMRMDSIVYASNLGDIETYVVADTEYSYMWGPGMGEVGIKSAIPPEDEYKDLREEAGTEEPDESGVGSIKYLCEKWKVDASKFIVPDTVIFRSYDEGLEELANQATEWEEVSQGLEEGIEGIDLSDLGCSSCELIPDEDEKTECLDSLGCL